MTDATLSSRGSIEDRIREDIVRGIKKGAWRAGDRIPFEHELAAQYACSRATVSKALASVARAGLIERRRKAGSFVARPKAESAVLAIPDIAEIVAANGGGYRFEVLGARKREASKLLQGAPALMVSGVHFSADGPFAYESREINIRAAPDILNADFAQESPGAWLLRNIPWSEATSRITAIAADRDHAAKLAIGVGAPCLQIERTTWRARTIITSVRQIFPGARYSLIASFNPAAP